jgi:3-oxoacyl-[acyl-carrier protein] reductase
VLAGIPEARSCVANRIKAAGGRALTVKADVGITAEVARLFDIAEQEFDGVDVLVNNAGILSNATIAATDDEMLAFF